MYTKTIEDKKVLVIEENDHDLHELIEQIRTRIYESTMTNNKITEIRLPNLPPLFGVDVEFYKREEV
jgi:hypothetical protein